MADALPAPVRSRRKPQSRTVTLWKFQKEATDAVLAALDNPDPKADVRISVSAPTGSGKTVMMLSIVRDLWAKAEAARTRATMLRGCNTDAHPDSRVDGGEADETDDSEKEAEEAEMADRDQVLILVPSIQIATQMKTEAEKVMRKDFKVNCSIELEQGDCVSSGCADLTIATWQGLNKSAERLLKLQRHKFGLVIVDECHHAASPFFMRVLQYFNECIPLDKGVKPVKGLNHGVRVKLVGFSATPDRADTHHTTRAFPRRVYTVSALELIRGKKLSKMAYKMIDGGLDITALLKSANESEADMDGWSALDRENKLYEKCNAAIINEHQILASEGRKYTLVFVARLRQLYSLKIAFKAIGVEVEAVTGETPKVKREASVTKFRSGETPVLINCGALIEGADLPCTDCVVLARPTTSKIMITQMIGRGMRISKFTDKQDCLIVDFTVSAKSGLKRFPELYALVTDLGSTKVRAMNPRAKKLKVTPKQLQHSTIFDEMDEDGDKAEKVIDHVKAAGLAARLTSPLTDDDTAAADLDAAMIALRQILPEPASSIEKTNEADEAARAKAADVGGARTDSKAKIVIVDDDSDDDAPVLLDVIATAAGTSVSVACMRNKRKATDDGDLLGI